MRERVENASYLLLHRIIGNDICALNNLFNQRLRWNAGMRVRIILITTVFLYAISMQASLRLPGENHSDLRTVVQLMQKLSDSSISEQLEFQAVFIASLNALRSTASNVIIIEATDGGPYQQPTILIVETKSPYLLPEIIQLSAPASGIVFNFSVIGSHESLIIKPPTPPPLIS
ncbi:hypothetical protein [Desulfosediminicola flagellatus]|uniref:hypothetical protein n=1 Tax=Desulfosediminicola flagellatus TaxID=2569541 RepID=UPI0010AD830F|nr:hypothetical protein [Desulfosediminicola flagellatus]